MLRVFTSKTSPLFKHEYIGQKIRYGSWVKKTPRFCSNSLNQSSFYESTALLKFSPAANTETYEELFS